MSKEKENFAFFFFFLMKTINIVFMFWKTKFRNIENSSFMIFKLGYLKKKDILRVSLFLFKKEYSKIYSKK